jgi:hypothetical protein
LKSASNAIDQIPEPFVFNVLPVCQERIDTIFSKQINETVNNGFAFQGVGIAPLG